MTIVIALLVAAAGVALVLLPLIRGGAHYDVSGDLDADEPGEAVADSGAAAPPGSPPSVPEVPVPVSAGAETTEPAATEAVEPTATEAVEPAVDAAVAVGGDEGVAFGVAAGLDDLIVRYRVAVRAGTVCPRCRQANPPGSRFCFECGRAIGEDAEAMEDAAD